MKRTSLLLTLFVALFLLSSCGSRAEVNAQNEWKVYHAAKDSPVNPNFSAYSLEYPSAWKLDEAANHITFASEANLLKDVPEKLKSGQVIAELSLNVNMSPEEMVDTYATTLGNLVHFTDKLSFIVNGRPAAYREGTNPETGDQTFILAVDIGENTRGLLTARMAEGELDVAKETLMKMAQSLQMEK